MASQQCSGRQIEPLAVLDQRRPASTWRIARSSLIVPVTYSWGVAKLHYPAATRFWTIPFSRIAGWGSGMALDAGTAFERPVLSMHRGQDYYFALRAFTASPKLNHRLPAGDRCARAGKMGTPHAAGLAVRSLHRLFRNHVVCLVRLAAAVRGRRSLRGSRGAA